MEQAHYHRHIHCSSQALLRIATYSPETATAIYHYRRQHGGTSRDGLGRLVELASSEQTLESADDSAAAAVLYDLPLTTPGMTAYLPRTLLLDFSHMPISAKTQIPPAGRAFINQYHNIRSTCAGIHLVCIKPL